MKEPWEKNLDKHEGRDREQAIEAASADIAKFVAELVKPWTEFRGHEANISAILRKHFR